MNQAEQQLFLDKCEHAFLIFAGRNPQYEQSESNARRIAAELKALGLSPASAEHLQIAWDKLKPAPEPADKSVEAAARAFLLDGTFAARVRDMSSEEFERSCHDPAFALAVELSAPPAPANRPPTRGEIVRESGIAELARKGEIKIAPYDPATEVERSRREFGEGFANHKEPKPQPAGGVSHWSGVSFGDRRTGGVTNPGADIPLPKSVSQAQFDAAIRQEKQDHKLLEEAAAKSARRKRVMASRASR